MHKYNIVYTDLFENINILYNKIDIYVKHNLDAESFYVGNTIRELCEARDKCCPQFFHRGELLQIMDVLCTKLFYFIVLLYCIVKLIVFNTVLSMYEINYILDTCRDIRCR